MSTAPFRADHVGSLLRLPELSMAPAEQLFLITEDRHPRRSKFDRQLVVKNMTLGTYASVCSGTQSNGSRLARHEPPQ